jgi:hypothetical protein
MLRTFCYRMGLLGCSRRFLAMKKQHNIPSCQDVKGFDEQNMSGKQARIRKDKARIAIEHECATLSGGQHHGIDGFDLQDTDFTSL